MRSVILFLASGGFLGYAPVASGTFGTLAGIPLFWALCALREVSVLLYVGVVVAFVLAACWIADEAETALQEHDSGKIVIDEVAGYIAATLFLEFTVVNVIVTFLVFRFFDIVKPFPASYIDKQFPGGVGVVLDDVVAGMYTNVITWLFLLCL